MCRSIYASLIVLLTMCLMNVLSFASADFESLSNSTNSLPFNHFEEPKSSHIDINILALSFHNVMARNNKNVIFFYNNLIKGVYLTPGQTYVILDKMNGIKAGAMYWDRNCISFLAYDPSAEAGHQKIFWNIKEDGLYHSWDNNSWQKKKSWTFNHC
uniref:S-protein homolog n=1 Tax=Phaseolus vulgaris TaxID=3885 RepID=V7BA45_PHAVU|nr:hypothetical protein PHAVU_007G007700g [Phaseolus vulgaris]ESW14674.1 hypothetical protein PHAVU_007G007700g [Phaseolus vulgaris]